MTTRANSNQQHKELDQFIQFINELIDKLQESKQALSDTLQSGKYCLKLRKQRKAFSKHIKMTTTLFPKLSEKNQVDLELHYFRALRELRELIPKAERDFKDDYGFFIRHFLLRELKKTEAIITLAQQGMAAVLYKDNTQEILSNPELLKELSATWADIEDEY